MPIDGEPVVRVALRTRANVLPLGQQTHQHAHVVERFEDRDRTTTRREQRNEGIAHLGCPPDTAQVTDLDDVAIVEVLEGAAQGRVVRCICAR